MKEVSIVTNFNIITKQTSFEEMMFSIRRGDFENVIVQLRKIHASGDKSAYEKAKRALLAFTPSATFKGGRLMKFMLKYSYIIVLDFDKLTPEELARVRLIISLCPFTVACFVSPTGNGLKVFVCVKSGPEKHLKAFLSVQQYYTALTGVEIDASGKDITRLCFVSWDPELYYNPGAKVFDWEKGEEMPKVDKGNTDASKGSIVENVGAALMAAHSNEEDQPPEPPQHDQTKPTIPLPVAPSGTENIFKIYKRCIRFVEKFIQYTEGQRHNFILKLALEIRKRGIPEVTALFLIQQDYDLEIREAFNVVRDVYQFDLTKENADITANHPTTQPAIDTPSAKPPQKESPIAETQNFASLQKEFQGTGSDGSRSVQSKENQPKKPKKPIDPDLDECCFPTIEELDELYYSGGEPIAIPEDPAKNKSKIKMPYVQRTVEMMLSKVLELHYNVVSGQVDWRRKGSDDVFQRMEDHEENSIFRWLHLHDQFIPITTLHNILTSNFSFHFDPFIDYFKNLKKVDKKIDYIGQLIATIRTEDDEYWAFCFRKWFVAYAMSLYRKRVINHTIIVFVGAQGVGKTSWMRLLVPEALIDYLSPSALTADSKDTQIMLAECCLIILDELEALTRRDLAGFKELLTRQILRVRRPYGRSSSNLPRRASFIASVNSTQILTDPTGSRRYLCNTVKWIDYEHTVDIDACMAQAIALGNSGFKYWFDQDEIRELTDRNEAYMAKSIEEEVIETWLSPVTIDEWHNKSNLQYGKNICLMKAADVSGFLITKSKLLLQNNTNSLVGKIMMKLNFVRLCKKSGYYYIVRVLTDEDVASSRRTLDDSETPAEFEQDLNRYNNPDQFIEGKRKEDELPF